MIREMLRVRGPIPMWLRRLLGVIPFVVLAGLYLMASAQRQRENPKDRLMPGPNQFASGWTEVWKQRVVGYEERTLRSAGSPAAILSKYGSDFANEVVLAETREPLNPTASYSPDTLVRVPVLERRIVADTLSSIRRLALGLVLAVVVAISAGLLMGTFSPVEALLLPLFSGLAKVPPLAILPILFIFIGAGEATKIAIIALGTAPTLTLDIFQRAKEVPSELIIKAYTLGGSTLEVLLGVISPLTWPHVLNGLRLALGPAWVYLIASEAIAAESGLGYRIFVVQRQMAMNVILIYVAWIMALGMLMDWGIALWIRWRYRWLESNRGA